MMSALALAAGVACAQSAKTVINAVTNTNYPPFKFKDPATSKLTGFSVDLLDAIAAKMGAKANWNEAKFDQLLASILTKRADVIVHVSDTPERRESANFLDFLNEYSVFYALKDNAAQFPDATSLCGKKVAASRATTWPAQIAEWSDEHCTRAGKPAIIVVEVTITSDMILALSQGRADAAVSGAGTLAYQNTLENNRYMTVARLNRGELMGFGFPKDDPEFGEGLKKALGALMADGTYKTLMRKWSIPEDSAPERPMINGQP
ncbi:polar amino acid transport system substrate-binding protein [Bradyrhizobium sp. USDA 4509]